MSPFIALVHKDADSAYGLTFPDAPGCFSAADAFDEIFAKAEEALAVWADGVRDDGREVPRARDLVALKADPAWADSFEGADLVIAVPAPFKADLRAA